MVYGSTDPRVPISEAEQLVGEMKRLEKRLNRYFLMTKVMEFVNYRTNLRTLKI